MAKGARGGAARGKAANVDAMLAKMTLEEKSAQICSVPITGLLDGRVVSEARMEALLAGGIGEISRVGGDTDLEPFEVQAATRAVQEFLRKRTRLGIGAIVHEECLAGYMTRNATVFPQALGMATTWNVDLIREAATSIGALMRGVGVHQGLSPLLDVAREPRWGRIEESFGEDTYLVAAMGSAYVRGLQGDLKSGVMATGKHFVGYAIPEGGRNIASVRLGPRELRDVYLYPFEAAVKTAGLASVMNGYHEIDGVPATVDRSLLTGVLREEWGFDGVVVSDYSSIEMLVGWHRMAADQTEAARACLAAGVDVELNDIACYGRPLVEGVRRGRIPEALVDRAVRRVLAMKERLGILAAGSAGGRKATVAMFDSPENRVLSRRVAEESICLLKNENGILPLKTAESIAVIGPNADSKDALLGDYTYMASMNYWRKAPKDYNAVRLVTVLDGVKARAGEGVRVAYAKGCEVADASKDLFEQAVEAAAASDVIIAVMGENGFLYTGEHRDRDDLGLLGVQEELVAALASTGVPVVLVLLNGRPLALGNVDKYCAAVVEAWYPGEEGGHAVASVLFGDVSPSGRLPVSFPENVGQIPVHYSRKPLPYRGYVPAMAKGEPRYAFGSGLTYTTFAYSDSRGLAGARQGGRHGRHRVHDRKHRRGVRHRGRATVRARRGGIAHPAAKGDEGLRAGDARARREKEGRVRARHGAACVHEYGHAARHRRRPPRRGDRRERRRHPAQRLLRRRRRQGDRRAQGLLHRNHGAVAGLRPVSLQDASLRN